jgi:hypothetical protein
MNRKLLYFLLPLHLLNLIVLTGQLWPEGAPPFARMVNIVFLFANYLFIGWLALFIYNKPKA